MVLHNYLLYMEGIKQLLTMYVLHNYSLCKALHNYLLCRVLHNYLLCMDKLVDCLIAVCKVPHWACLLNLP